MLYKVVLTSKSVDKTLVCGNSNESFLAVLSLYKNGTHSCLIFNSKMKPKCVIIVKHHLGNLD